LFTLFETGSERPLPTLLEGAQRAERETQARLRLEKSEKVGKVFVLSSVVVFRGVFIFV